MHNEHRIKTALSFFDLGKTLGVSKIDGGIVNNTYKITASTGEYVLQCLSPVFGKNVVEDQRAIQEHLHKHNFPVPKLVSAKNADNCIVSDGNVWRILRYIENNKTVKNTQTIAEAAKMLARFHKILKKCSYQPKFKIPDFHNTKNIIQKLIVVADRKKYRGKSFCVVDELSFIVGEVESCYLPEHLPPTLIHGDPKFENFLFLDNRVVGLVDLDTIMLANELVDLGDALRDWSCKEGGRFDKVLFEVVLAIYLEESELGDISFLVKDATALLALELAARFLTDYFEEKYFQWDQDVYLTAGEHNLKRCRENIFYYKDFIKSF